MSNSIKDIIKTFKTLQEQEEQPTKEVVTTGVGEESIKQVELVTPKTTVVKTMKENKSEKPEKPKKTAQIVENQTSKMQVRLNDAFFNALADKDFNNKDRAIAYLETELYEIFMGIKRKKKIRNVSILINAILNQFVEDNKDEIRTILTNTRL